MSTIWLPVPVATLFRRLVNLVSTASIAHHYLLPSRACPASERDLDPRPACRVLWENGQQDVGAYASPGKTGTADGLDGFLKASIPWLRWPARPSLFQPASRTANYAQQLSEPPRTDPDGHSPVPNPYPPPPPSSPIPTEHKDRGAIHRLMQSPVLYDPLRAPRFPIVLCHGLYGFDVRGPPSLRMQYWSSILGILRKIVGAEVIVTAVPGTGSIASRAEQLDRFLQAKAPGRGINFMAHSMGGLDCRHLITHLKPVEYAPLSLTTIATPHRGSPFMDWCKDYLGLGRRRPEHDEERSTMTTIDAIDAAEQVRSQTRSLSSLPSSFTTFLLGLFDSPAYANLTTSYLTETFNPRTPDDPRVRYFSIAGRMTTPNIWHPLWFPKVVLDSVAGVDTAGNDGLVSVDSARWGEFLGTLEGADHWAVRGASGIELDVDPWGFAVDWGRALGLRRDNTTTTTTTTTTKEVTKDEAALRSSTDRLSAVVDWLVEQVPVASRGAFSFAGASDGAGTSPQWHLPSSASAPPKPKPRGDLESAHDLERLYVALARKLYDEGL
ncbi:alpha/beta-hydrolase [Lactarius sanguifluus]|nr:alpha/beta-hydrolase [Lactarius sanguifluus]